MVKIAIVTNIPAPYRVNLYNYMQKELRGFDINIFYGGTPESQGRSWTIDKEKLGNSHFYNIIELIKHGVNDDRYIQIWSSIGRELSWFKPDVVISFEYNMSSVLSLLWCKWYKTKYIHLTDGTLYSERNIGKGQKLLRQFIVSNSDVYIASSTKAKEKLEYWGAKSNKIFVAYLTNDVSKYKSIEKEPEQGRILYVGSMIRRKGLDLLLKALKDLTCKFQLRIVGNGSEEQLRYLKSLVKEYGMQDKVLFCGFKEGEELLEEYCKANLFVLPAREDCFGLVLVEALAAGVPIVGSKFADGVYDTIIPKHNGLIADPYDTNKFRECIEEVLKHNSYTENARNMSINKFEYRNVAYQYVQAVNYVLADR